MSIKTGIAALALATLAVTGSIASTTQAEAKGLGWGIGAGLLGAAVVEHGFVRTTDSASSVALAS